MASHLVGANPFSSSVTSTHLLTVSSTPPPRLTISAVSKHFDLKTPPQPKIPTATNTTTKVNSPPQTSIDAAICNTLDNFINTHIDPPHLRPTVDPNNVLSGNFAPVSELPPTPCTTISGTLPQCLAGGAYIRNGPNPQYQTCRTHHLIDGDGMLHSLLLPTTNSAATLSSHFVRTYKYNIESTAGASVFPNAFSGLHGFAGLARSIVTVLRFLSGQIDPHKGTGLANTAFSGLHGFAGLATTATRQVRCSAGSERDDFYHRLSVGQTADQAEIKAAFRKQARKWHPDVCHSLADKEYYAKQFTKAKDAYDVLSDPVLRCIYDLELRDDLEVYTINRPRGGLWSFLKREPIGREELEAQLDGLRKRSAFRAAKRVDEMKEESGRFEEQQ